MKSSIKSRKLHYIFEGDGKEIRNQFIYAGLILSIFESFKKFIVGNVEFFFCNEVSMNAGRLAFKRGEDFKKNIRERGAGKQGQHGNKDFCASMSFFYENDAINDFECAEREVEAATAPDMAQEKYDSIFWDEVQNIETIMLREILNKSLCDNGEWKTIPGWVEEMQKNI